MKHSIMSLGLMTLCVSTALFAPPRTRPAFFSLTITNDTDKELKVLGIYQSRFDRPPDVESRVVSAHSKNTTMSFDERKLFKGGDVSLRSVIIRFGKRDLKTFNITQPEQRENVVIEEKDIE